MKVTSQNGSETTLLSFKELVKGRPLYLWIKASLSAFSKSKAWKNKDFEHSVRCGQSPFAANLMAILLHQAVSFCFIGRRIEVGLWKPVTFTGLLHQAMQLWAGTLRLLSRLRRDLLLWNFSRVGLRSRLNDLLAGKSPGEINEEHEDGGQTRKKYFTWMEDSLNN